MFIYFFLGGGGGGGGGWGLWGQLNFVHMIGRYAE